MDEEIMSFEQKNLCWMQEVKKSASENSNAGVWGDFVSLYLRSPKKDEFRQILLLNRTFHWRKGASSIREIRN